MASKRSEDSSGDAGWEGGGEEGFVGDDGGRGWGEVAALLVGRALMLGGDGGVRGSGALGRTGSGVVVVLEGPLVLLDFLEESALI